MGNIQGIAFFVVFVGVLVTVHELGHFLAAKWLGVKVLKFSVGFGPKIVGFRRGETEYQVAWVPLGGYVRMAGEYPGDEPAPEDVGRTFNAAKWWKRAIIVLAGPAFNLIFPILAYFLLFLGDREGLAPRVGWVEPDLPAARAGIQPGDLILSINGRQIREWREISETIRDLYEREIPLVVEREGQRVPLRITPARQVETNIVEKINSGLLGISGPRSRVPIVGVPPSGPAREAGLETFDRILTVNGRLVRDELGLIRLLRPLSGTLEVVVVRSELRDIGGATYVVPKLVTATMEKQPGEGFAALGVEAGDLYAWTVLPGSPAAQAGLRRGDRLLAVDGVPVASLLAFNSRMKAIQKKPFLLTWQSGEEQVSQTLRSVVEKSRDEYGNVGETLELGFKPRPAYQLNELLAAGSELERVTIHLGPAAALQAALKTVPNAIRAVAIVLGKVLTREISFDAVGGPIMLFQVAQKSAEQGIDVFLQNMAMVSVNLGLVNLLPIPILDGFSLLAALWEGIRRRPIPMRAREVANIVGLVLLVLLMVRVFINDIQKLLP